MTPTGSRPAHRKAPASLARVKRVTAALGVTLPLALAAGALAQDGPARHLSFGIDQRLESSTNQSLTTPAEGTTTLSTTRLSFGLTSETAVDRIALSASGVIRAGSGPGLDGNGTTFDDRRVGLRYTHSAATGEIGLDASLRDDNIRFLRPLEDFLNPDTGEIELPEDLETLEGNGTRRSTAVAGRLRFGDQARLGVTLRASLSQIDYIGAAAGLADSERLSYGADFRFSINDVTSATLGLTRQDFTSDAAPGTRTTDTLSLGVSREFVNGSGSVSLSIADKPGAIRTTSLSFGRNYETQDSTFGFSLGASRTAGNSNLTGTLRYSRELPSGAVNLSLSRGVSTSSDDTDRLVTLLSAGYSHEINQNSKLGLTATWSESRQPGGGGSSTNGALGLTYSHALTEDWSLNTGLTHRTRDTATSPAATSNTVFIGLSRRWE